MKPESQDSRIRRHIANMLRPVDPAQLEPSEHLAIVRQKLDEAARHLEAVDRTLGIN